MWGSPPVYAGATWAARTACRRTWEHPPARAGTTPRPSAPRRLSEGHLRTRGGPLGGRGRHPASSRTTPAHAGTTARAGGRSPSAGDHPRTRGEHFLCEGGLSPYWGPSPHARGALFVTCGFRWPEARFHSLLEKRIYLPCAANGVFWHPCSSREILPFTRRNRLRLVVVHPPRRLAVLPPPQRAPAATAGVYPMLNRSAPQACRKVGQRTPGPDRFLAHRIT